MTLKKLLSVFSMLGTGLTLSFALAYVDTIDVSELVNLSLSVFMLVAWVATIITLFQKADSKK